MQRTTRLMRRVASMPSIPGSAMSMITTCGAWPAHSSSASSALSAPSTRHSGNAADTSACTAARVGGWSSTIMMTICLGCSINGSARTVACWIAPDHENGSNFSDPGECRLSGILDNTNSLYKASGTRMKALDASVRCDEFLTFDGRRLARRAVSGALQATRIRPALNLRWNSASGRISTGPSLRTSRPR